MARLSLFSLLLLLLPAAKEAVQSSSDPFPVGPTKSSHLHFFFHDVLSGKDPSAINTVISPVTKAGPGFGGTYVIDDPLTETAEASSKLLGRAQGSYTVATKTQAGGKIALQMYANFVFVDGDFNGSSLVIMGRNNVMTSKRELPVVGGSGSFRMARGYAILHTHSVNISTGDAVVEYDVYVQHYGSSGVGVGKESVAGGDVGGSGREEVVGFLSFVCYLWVFLCLL